MSPGVYTSSSGTFELTGTLTLDADDPNDAFIFQMASTLKTASGSIIELDPDGAATFCQVFWQVGSSATLGTNSTFVGHILALTSITANSGADIEGQLLARNGAVTLDNNTITNVPCAANVNNPVASYDETLDVTIIGADTGTGTGYTYPEATLLGTESVLGSESVKDSDVLSGARELPATGGFPIAEALSVMGMALMAIGGVLLKKKLV